MNQPQSPRSRGCAIGPCWVLLAVAACADPGSDKKQPGDTGAPPDTDTATDSTGADSDTAMDTEVAPDSDTALDSETAGDSETAADTDTGTEPPDPPYSWPELVLAEAELAFSSIGTNGPCPTDTLFDEPLAHWDYLDPTRPFSDYYPALQDAWGETTWYGADVWKMQFTVLEWTTTFETYSATVEVRYVVCADDGVHLAGTETWYGDPEYENYRVTLYDPPPLYLPADRTEGSTWAADYAWSAYWWDGRAWPDSGYESGTATLNGSVGATAPLTVPAGTWDAVAIEVDGQTSYWAEAEGLLRQDGYELVERSTR